MATQDNEKIIWVMGNKQSVIIPMEQEVIPQEGDPYTEDFYPAEGDVVKVTLTGAYRPYIYTPEVDGHLLILTDNGTLPKGLYGVQITIMGSNGETRLRSFWDQQIVVTERNNSVLREWDEFKQQPVEARAAVFFFAKGDKGDAFTYEDFTQEQIEDLKKPAYDAAADVTALEQSIEGAEALRVQAEQGRVDAEALRVTAEHGRADDEALRISAEQGRVDAEALRATAEQGRADAEALRVSAEQSRIDAEALRVTAEQGRVDNEVLRVTAEEGRSDAETLRVRAEQTRQQNESSRTTTFNADHQTATTDHTTAAGDHTQAGTDHLTASADHTLAASDHTTAGTDHTTAGNDHTQAVSDHGTATSDHEAYEQAIGTINGKMDEITQEQFNEIFN